LIDAGVLAHKALINDTRIPSLSLPVPALMMTRVCFDQLLNRAKPPAEGAVEKKTWQGKTVHAQ
jgi:hypothetical protein